MSTQDPSARSSTSIQRLRNLILLCLVLGVAAYTAVMLHLTQRLSEQFGPQVRSDLEWRVQRGAHELAGAAELGVAIGDGELVKQSFGAYAASRDVRAIVAVDAKGKTIAEHGLVPATDLFAGPQGMLRTEPDYLISWMPVEIEGARVGKVAVVVSTERLQEANTVLARSSHTMLAGGISALLLGSIVVLFFTSAVARRDTRLSHYAENLERMVQERTRELHARNQGMRLVLDNVAQGFVTIDRDGRVASERSAIVDHWFGKPAPGATLMDYLTPHCQSFAAELSLGLEELRDGIMPTELVVHQLPRRLTEGERTFEVSYSPIGELDTPERLLVIISDITQSVARERAEQEQKELMTLFRLVSEDAAGVEAFLVEAAHLAASLRDEKSFTVQCRLLHTLKGNCTTFGLASFANLIHAAESELVDQGTPLCASRREALVGAWKQTVQRVGWLLGGTRRGSIVVDAAELQALSDRVAAGAGNQEIAAVLSQWSLEPIRRGCERLARQIGALARRLDKPPPELTIEDRGIRVDGERFAPFWTAMVHVVRNALDHGIEDPETRALAGKTETGHIVLAAKREDETLTIVVRDDGRGLSWQQLAKAAKARGVPHESRADLIEALFADGVTTCEHPTQVSGRGVGMAAIRQVVQELGGRIEVESTEGRGTEFRFVFPERGLAPKRSPRERLARTSLLPSVA